LHTRAGNAMGRTRDSLLDGALSVVERDGLRALTMSAVAVRSGVAKATLYNHFRTKDEVLVALVVREVELAGAEAVAAARAGCPEEGLDVAARCVAQHVAVRWLADTDPAGLLPLVALAPSEALDRARACVAEVLGASAAGPAAPERVDLVLHWLAAQLLAPQDDGDRRAAARLLAQAQADGSG
jgi:AcrR family transcriptional regulator